MADCQSALFCIIMDCSVLLDMSDHEINDNRLPEKAGSYRSGQSVFAAIDLKSFYASVECVERGLDPLKALLVVADESRTEKTICLAVSPALKAYGLPGRCRLFEVVEKARQVKRQTGKDLEYLVAPPRMRLYMDYSARIYEKVYLRFVSPEDIHVYSVDEVMIDLTKYLKLYKTDAHDLVRRIIREILKETGITATAGIGTNLYLAKVAMDIVAKHVPADRDGVRIAELDERSYRERLWQHQPITSFWRVGRGIAERLKRYGCVTMGDVARLSLNGQDLLYKEFGVDAELLIDHAWGVESCTMADIKSYRPSTSSLSAGQVLAMPYPADKARIVVSEMAEQLAFELFDKRLKASSVTLTVIYDPENIERKRWTGPVVKDYYQRTVPKEAHGSQNLTDVGGAPIYTNSVSKIIDAVLQVYDRTVEPSLTVRRMYLALNNTVWEDAPQANIPRQLDLFTDERTLMKERDAMKREQSMQEALLNIKKKYGKNAILRGVSYQEGATARERNRQIGGHASGMDEGGTP